MKDVYRIVVRGNGYTGQATVQDSLTDRTRLAVWCRLLALSGHSRNASECPLSGVKRTPSIDGQNVRLCPWRAFQNCRSMSAFEGKVLAEALPHMTQKRTCGLALWVSVFGDKADRW